MKKIILALTTLACSIQLSLAQSSNIPDTEYLTVDQQREILMQTRHEIRLGSSFLSVPKLSALIASSNPDFTRNWAIPTISLDYTYRIVDFLEVGGLFSYDLSGYTFNDETPSKCNSHTISIVAYARYSWLNRRYIQLYSSLGFGININNEVSTDINTGITTTSSDPFPMPEFVPIGVRFGGRLFGYFEPIGISARGMILSLGIGYKF